MNMLTISFSALLGIVFVLDLAALLDISRRKFHQESERRKWLNRIFLIPVAGAIMYLFRRNKLQEQS